MNFDNLSKYQKLGLSILFDAIGYVSFIFPPFVFDAFWAPATLYLMTKLYKGNTGKIAGAISFIEEIMPGLDVLPTFSLMWIYTHILKLKNQKKQL